MLVVDGDDVVPVAFRGDLTAETLALPLELLRAKVGVGITGRCAQTGESLLIGDAANCEFATRIPGTPLIEESLLAVALRYGSRVVGVIVISKLGLDQFDEDDVRLLEVLAGHAAVAVENASLYESARREAESATSLLEFGRELATAANLDDILQRVVELSADLLESPRTSIWLENEDGRLAPRKLHGYSPEERASLEARRFDAAKAREGFIRGPGPFVLGPSEWTRVEDDPLDDDASYALAPIEVDGRVGCIVAALPAGDFRGAGATPARRPRAPGEARDREREQLRGAGADIRVDGRGARERARGERRVHLAPRALDHRSLAPRRPRARARGQRRSSISSSRRCCTTSARSGFRATSSRSRAGSPSTSVA